MKKLILLFVLVSNVVLSQTETKMEKDVYRLLSELRVSNNLSSLKNNAVLDSAAEYFLESFVSQNEDNISYEVLSDSFKINVFRINFYVLDNFNESWYNDQLTKLIEFESPYHLSAKESTFINVSVKCNQAGRFVTIVSYGTKNAICHLPERN